MRWCKTARSLGARTSLSTLAGNDDDALPSLIAISGYALAFYFLSLTLRTMPVGVIYAIWSGAGIVLIAAVGWVMFRQTLDAPALIGIGLIITGVAVINLFSKSLPH